MPKVNEHVPFEPNILLWGKPRERGSTAGGFPSNWAANDPRRAAGESEHRIRKHPKVSWKCKHFELNDAASRFPDNPDFTDFYTSLNYEQRIARRIREHAQDQIALGWQPEFLHFFIQKLGDEGPNGGSPGLCRSPADAEGIVTGDENHNMIYTSKAENGPLTSYAPETRIPVTEANQRIANALKTELQNAGIGPLGFFTNDMENLHEPWRWCRSFGAFGTWNLNVNDPRYETEIIISGSHGLRTSNGVSHTLKSWIDECRKERAPSFAPVFNQNQSSTSNISSGSTREMHTLRLEASISAFARCTTDVWKQDPFWENLQINNYNMMHADNPKFPTHMSGGGSRDAEHISRYFGLDISHYSCYPVNQNNGMIAPAFKRFSPRHRFGVSENSPTGQLGSKRYDEVQYLAVVRRYISSHKMSSESHRPVMASIRGMDAAGDPRVPTTEVIDLVRVMKAWASYEKTQTLLIWFNDNQQQRPQWDKMLSAIEQVYPQWVWDSSIDDWVNVNSLNIRVRASIRRLNGNFDIIEEEPTPIVRP